VEVVLRPTASLSWCQATVWDPWPIFIFYLLILFRQCRICYYGASSLMRGRVCNLQLLLGHARTVFLGLESPGIHCHTLFSKICDSFNLEGEIPLFFSSRNTLYPRQSFTPNHVKLQLSCDRRPVFLGVGLPSGTDDEIFLSV
jgi:hypothetical protein